MVPSMPSSEMLGLQQQHVSATVGFLHLGLSIQVGGSMSHQHGRKVLLAACLGGDQLEDPLTKALSLSTLFDFFVPLSSLQVTEH